VAEQLMLTDVSGCAFPGAGTFFPLKSREQPEQGHFLDLIDNSTPLCTLHKGRRSYYVDSGMEQDSQSLIDHLCQNSE
jgi:hypothetical protein